MQAMVHMDLGQDGVTHVFAIRALLLLLVIVIMLAASSLSTDKQLLAKACDKLQCLLLAQEDLNLVTVECLRVDLDR